MFQGFKWYDWVIGLFTYGLWIVFKVIYNLFVKQKGVSFKKYSAYVGGGLFLFFLLVGIFADKPANKVDKNRDEKIVENSISQKEVKKETQKSVKKVVKKLIPEYEQKFRINLWPKLKDDYGQYIEEFYITAIVETKDSNYLALVRNGTYASDYIEYYAVMLNKNGKILWYKLFDRGTKQNGEITNDYHLSYIEETNDGFLAVGTKGFKVFILGIGKDGKKKFERVVENTSASTNQALVVKKANNFLVTSKFEENLYYISRDGKRLWGYKYEGLKDKDIDIRVIKKLDNGNFLVVGRSGSVFSRLRNVFLEIDDKGNVVNKKMLFNDDYAIKDVIQAYDNDFLFLSAYERKHRINVAYIKWHNNSENEIREEWFKTDINIRKGVKLSFSPYRFKAVKAIKTDDKGYFVCFYQYEKNGKLNPIGLYLAKLDNNGKTIWDKEINIRIKKDSNPVIKVIKSKDDSIVIALERQILKFTPDWEKIKAKEEKLKAKEAIEAVTSYHSK
jgi:hypothetical protein